MSNNKSKDFDCVQTARQIRDRLSKEIENLSHDEITRWLRSHRYSNPLLQRLAERAAAQAAAADGASPHR